MLPTRRYSQVKELRRRGLMSRATGPCAIDGCAIYRPSQAVYDRCFVYDHCHEHDYIRGVICLWHNTSMAMVDAHVMDPEMRGSGRTSAAREAEAAALLAHWARCPGCAASGEWEPYQTRAEYGRGQVIKRIIGLADEIAACERMASMDI